jgi:hypothetical protein
VIYINGKMACESKALYGKKGSTVRQDDELETVSNCMAGH